MADLVNGPSHRDIIPSVYRISDLGIALSRYRDVPLSRCFDKQIIYPDKQFFHVRIA